MSNASSQIHIAGKIEDYGSTAELVYWEQFKLHLDTITFDKHGQFKVKYDSGKPLFIRVRTIKPVISTPFMIFFFGDSVNIEMNRANITISGGAAGYNNFLISHHNDLKSRFIASDYNAITEYALKSSDTFFSSYEHKDRELIKKLHDQAIAINDKLYPLLVKYNNNDQIMGMIANFFKTRQRPAVDTLNILTYLDRIDPDYENSSLGNNSDFIMLNNFFRVMRLLPVKKDIALEEVDEYVTERNIIKEVLRESSFRTKLLAYSLHFRIENSGKYRMQLTSVDEYIEQFKKEIDNQRFLPHIEALYEAEKKTIGSLSRGAAAPAFTPPDETGKFVSLSDFKGKVVYLDLWASWCAPCLKEMRPLKELREKYLGKDVELISISIDTERDSWLQKIRTMELGGVQLIDQAGSVNSKIAKDYKVSGVPHYILIDKKGRIASSYAPRPSDAEIEKQINALL